MGLMKEVFKNIGLQSLDLAPKHPNVTLAIGAAERHSSIPLMIINDFKKEGQQLPFNKIKKSSLEHTSFEKGMTPLQRDKINQNDFSMSNYLGDGLGEW